ncbi:unnamed protein product [Toxocara canis]|uniref:Dynein light chain n=1 Tax=Toxocara canis TaxID=6265 RepID=A0A183UN53_TOXCA|nr:unnamed protein product [Toxocara canis]
MAFDFTIPGWPCKAQSLDVFGFHDLRMALRGRVLRWLCVSRSWGGLHGVERWAERVPSTSAGNYFPKYACFSASANDNGLASHQGAQYGTKMAALTAVTSESNSFYFSCKSIAQKIPRYFFQDVAAYIKEECERRFGPTWHCVVGKSFGSRVSYEMQHFVLLRRRRVSIMIFKCGY